MNSVNLRNWLSSLVVALGLMLGSAAHAASMNGLWTMNNGDFLVLMQDVNSGKVVGLQVAANYSSMKVWYGSGTSTNLTLAGVPDTTQTMTGTFSSSNLISGNYTVAGVSTAFTATLTYAYVGGVNDGVWQKANLSNAYLIYLTLSVSSQTVPIQVDVTVNADMTIAYDIFTGSYSSSNNTFTGLSVLNPTLTDKLVFSSGSLSGTYTTIAKPPVSTTFSASQIIKLSN